MRRIDKVFKSVKNCNVKKGDLVVFHVDPNSFPPDEFQKQVGAVIDDVHAKLKAGGVNGVTFLVLGPGQKVNMISEDDMNKNGWFRKGGDQ